MTDTNKENLINWAKSALIGVIALLGIITSAGVWNGVANGAIGSFYGWVAGINLIVEGFGVYSLYKKLFPKKVDNKQNEKS